MENGHSRYNVGGLLLDRPFKIRRLGHFGLNLENLEQGVRFYTEFLGFRLSDVMDLRQTPRAHELTGVADARLFFTSYGTDHHALVLGHKSMASRGGVTPRPDNTINQITWQLGTLSEVVNAYNYVSTHGGRIHRVGRDMPGSNWHVYVFDPDGHVVELYYGIEQRGWNLLSKPRSMYYRRMNEVPTLPQPSEQTELEEAIQKGIDVFSGYRSSDSLPAKYEVGGVMLPRPFKVTRIGPVSLFVQDVEKSAEFYSGMLGFVKTEDAVFNGKRCLFLRNGTEHHSLGLFPKELRAELELNPNSSLMSFGMEVGSYEQLRNAVRFLSEKGVRFTKNIPPDLYPGIDYAAHAIDPDGHCIQLYYYMEQVGWDGKPRPKEMRRKVSPEWPETLEPLSDSYVDQTFQGPLG